MQILDPKPYAACHLTVFITQKDGGSFAWPDLQVTWPHKAVLFYIDWVTFTIERFAS